LRIIFLICALQHTK